MSTSTPSAKPAKSPLYLWQHPAWPALTFDAVALTQELSQARLQQGKLLGLLESIGLEPGQEVARELWVQEAMATAAIEGDKLDLEALRSSVAHRLGLADLPTADRHVDGLVQVMQDATEHISSQAVGKHALEKAGFRLRCAANGVNARQTKVLNRLLEAGSTALGGGFSGGMSSDKYSKITGVSKATATRDLTDLAAKGLLRVDGAGKATRYAITIDHWEQLTV